MSGPITIRTGQNTSATTSITIYRWDELHRYESNRQPDVETPPTRSVPWQAALLAGLQAGAVWLRRAQGGRGLLVALAGGAANGTVAYVAGPLFGAAASLALSLLAPADATHTVVAGVHDAILD